MGTKMINTLLISVAVVLFCAKNALGNGTTCNFDGSLCGYSLSADEDRFKWQQIGKNKGLPTEDHTIGTKGSNGQFLTVKWRSGTAGNQKSIITSPRIPQTNAPCSIGFYYYMNSDQISLTAHVKTVSTQQTKQIWAHQVKGDGWTYSGPIDISSFSNLGDFQVFLYIFLFTIQVLIQAQIKPGYAFSKVVSIDDVTFTGCGNGAGPVNPTSSTTLKTTTTPSTTSSTTTSMKITTSMPTSLSDYGSPCNFDGSLCGYSLTSDEDRFKWQKIGNNKGFPTEEHTNGHIFGSKGEFLTAKWTSGKANGQKATILSPVISQTSTSCSMEFYYYLNTDQITLTVFVKTLSTNQKNQMWVNKGMAPSWTSSGSIDISSLSNKGDFQVMIQAQLGTNYLFSFSKVVSIDDVSFSGCNCAIPPCKGFGAPCTFDGAMCDYTVTADMPDSFKWLMVGMNKGLPTEDHTIGRVFGSKGQFMMAKWSRGTSGQQTTSMTSPVVSQTNRPCSMSFFYYFNSDDISLAVYVLTLNLVQPNRIWYKPGNGATNGWESSGVLDLSQFSSGGRFQVRIRAQMKPGFTFGKIVSVDDVFFSGCDCSTPPCTVPAVINTPSPSSSVSTTVTSAVPVVSEPDLGLGAPCTFDGFDCGYSVAWSSANYKWQRTGANKGMPNYDHTVGSVLNDFVTAI
ncbi:MAM and LDL-receptor class A domain-containing protein 1 [Lingula anatina]|uniref:MAM and LDL-receptor class A domain-containing protein 1 n=1 Tax=Lingula anatina TaxID=7574 RepID=A0A1S3JH64_LINAN|nr:MAM and LDL-receptor class A domain-containing protein 1 [Lingula anatina]|eukprot:XP_013409481.1 MAM and LDL-receptor class A domain-containing protein 1 [Lingula anatina]